jgi:hypothetical protein
VKIGELGHMKDRDINWRITLEYNREIMVYDVDWAHLVFGGSQWQAFRHSDNVSVGSIKENLKFSRRPCFMELL